MSQTRACRILAALAAGLTFGQAGVAWGACTAESVNGMEANGGSNCAATLSAYAKLAGVGGTLHSTGSNSMLTHNGAFSVAVSTAGTNAYGVLVEYDGAAAFHRDVAVMQTGTGASNSAIRAMDGGVITVNGRLTANTVSVGSRGIYVSGRTAAPVAEVALNGDTSITTAGMAAPAIQIGKVPSTGTGSGIVRAKAYLEATTTSTSSLSSSPALYLGYNGSLFDASYATSSGVLTSASRTILLSAGANMGVSLHDYTVSTTGSGTSMAPIYISGKTTNGTIDLSGSTVSAPTTGYLVLSEGKEIHDSSTYNPIGAAGAFSSSVLLSAKDHSQLTGSISTNASSTLGLTLDNSVWTLAGYGGALNTASSLTTLTMQNAAALNAGAGAATANFTVKAGVTNTGSTISLADGDVSDVLTIDGNLTLNNGRVSIDTALGDDTSLTDRLVITGDATGTGVLSVTNAGGLGAATSAGIRVIEVQGVSSATFTLAAPVVVGGWQYTLAKVGNDWYLRSILFNPPSAASIPVNASWALLLLGVMLLAAGWYRQRFSRT